MKHGEIVLCFLITEEFGTKIEQQKRLNKILVSGLRLSTSADWLPWQKIEDMLRTTL